MSGVNYVTVLEKNDEKKSLVLPVPCSSKHPAPHHIFLNTTINVLCTCIIRHTEATCVRDMFVVVSSLYFSFFFFFITRALYGQKSKTVFFKYFFYKSETEWLLALKVTQQPPCVAKVSNTSRTKLFLLFTGKERTNMAAPHGAQIRRRKRKREREREEEEEEEEQKRSCMIYNLDC